MMLVEDIHFRHNICEVMWGLLKEYEYPVCFISQSATLRQ
jgi:hypothetical protein